MPAIWKPSRGGRCGSLQKDLKFPIPKSVWPKHKEIQCGFLLIELNPGPVKWPCGYCGEAVSSRVWSIYCVDCKKWIHQRCAGMSTQEIRAHQNFRWHCGCVTVPTVPVAPVAVLQPAAQTEIELNPGPVKWPCGYCGEAVSSRVWSIYCVDCKKWIHQRCAGMSTQEIRAHQNFRWHCGCVTVPTVLVAPVAVLQPAAQTRRPRVKTPVPRCLKILQLNIDGWRGKVTSLNEFLDEKKIDVALLQETKLMSSTAGPIANGWKVHRAERTVHLAQNEQPQGGLAVLVRPGVQSRRLESLNLPTGAALESLGVSVETKHGWMNLWNMYRPPATGGADVRDAALYLNHWPREKSSVICADVNAHGSWDASRDSDQLGEEIDDWLIDNSMAHVNSGIPTRVRQLGHAMVETAPGITIVHSSVASSCSWDVMETIGSDHLPIQLVIGCSGMKEEETKRKYNFNKTDWEKYISVCHRSLPEWNEETMQKAAKESNPFTKVGGNRKPWWSSLCESAKRSMKDAFSPLRRSPCEENLKMYKNAQKMFADTIREEKRRS